MNTSGILLALAFLSPGEASKRLDKKKLAALVARKPVTCRLFGRQTMQLPAFVAMSNLGCISIKTHAK